MRTGLTGVTVERAHGGPDVADVDLDVQPGTLTAVVGGDGAGKTTLLRVLAGAVAPTSGQVHVPARDRIGYVSAGAGVYDDLTVEQNLRFAAAAYGIPRDQVEARMVELLATTQLAGARHRLAGNLSGGMRQKLGFACAMLHAPDLLIMDEPTTGVDPVSRAELWRLVSTALAHGTAAVFSTTYLDEADRADHVVVLDRGRVVVAGAPGEVADDLPRADRAARARARPTRTHRARPHLLAVDDLVSRFGATTAVDGATLHVDPGEVVGLLGANGAGKTTTIRAALGLLRPTSGTVSLMGGAPDRARRRHVGYVPQGLGLWQDLTAQGNLAFVAAAYGVPAPSWPADLEEVAHVLVGDLPLGTQRRVAFACARSHDPRLLVLDEPTSGVALQERASLWEDIHALRDAGAGVLVTTHHMSEAEQCDRVVVLMAGRVVASGTIDDLLEGRHAVQVTAQDWAEAFTRLDDAFDVVALQGRAARVPDADVADVRSALGGLDAEVTRVAASFEEVFVALGRRA